MRQPPILVRHNDRLTPNTRLAKLARHALLETLSGPQLAVYIRLIAATAEQGSRRLQITNGALYRDPRTAARVLRELENLGLIRIDLGASHLDRRIEVAR